MKPPTHTHVDTPPPLHTIAPPLNPLRRRIFRQIPSAKRLHVTRLSVSAQHQSSRVEHTRRHVLLAPFLTAGACALQSAVTRAEENLAEIKSPEKSKSPVERVEVEEEKDVIVSRIYDATVIGEPMAVGKDKLKVWEKLTNARIVYLGEAEHVPVRDDKELELEIVKNLRKRCVESDRPISLALEAFPCDLQEQLNQYMDKRLIFFKIFFEVLVTHIIFTFY